ncbi:MAG: CBS domain-containing protein [Opitutales bacterium]
MNTSLAVILERKGSAVQTVPPTLTIAETVHVMNQKKISSVVVTEGGRLAGIFTERDVLRRVIGADLDPKRTLVRDVMSSGVTTVTPATTVQEALDIFARRKCRHLPVLAEGKLAGLISVGDVSRWIGEMHRAEAEQLKEYISGGYSA